MAYGLVQDRVRIRGLRIAAAVSGCLVGILATWALWGAGRVAAPTVTPQDAAVPDAAQGVISRTLGQADRRFFVHRVAGGFALDPEGRELMARFSRGGVVVSAGGVAWSVGLRGVGRAGRLVSAAAVLPVAHGNQVRYQRGRVSEWYANGARGLEQGFTLASRPRGAAGAPVTLALGELPAGVGMSVSGDRRSLALTRGGLAVLRYRGLFASDARGRALAARIVVSGRRLSLRVDDRRAVYPIRVDPFVQAGKLTASDGAPGDGLGSAVAVSGDTIAVGAPNAGGGSGAVYVFVKPAGGWADATQTAKLTASGGNGAGFGSSVAISGDTIVVGSPNSGLHNRGFVGLAFVFVKPAGGWADSTETAVLTNSDANPDDRFGAAVAVSGQTIVVAAPLAANEQGEAYVYTEPAGGWTDTQETAKLTASDPARDLFGGSVAVDGDIVAIGSQGASVAGQDSAGAVYLFVEPAGGWTSSHETAKLTASDARSGNALGTSVAVSGDTVVAGAPNTPGRFIGAGAVYAFVRPGGGWGNETETAELTASDGAANDQLGWSVATGSDTILAGAPGVGGNRNGAVYVFNKPPAGWADGAQSARLTASDEAGGDAFGSAVASASDGATLAGGSPSAGAGAAYVFTPGAGGGLRPTSTVVSCSPGSVPVGQASTCTVTGTDTGPGPKSIPAGTVTFSSDSHGTFGNPGASCTLNGDGTCHVDYTPAAVDSGTHRIAGSYGGDGTHMGSAGNTNLTVTAPARVHFTILRPSNTVLLCSPAPAVNLRSSITCWARVYDAGLGPGVLPSGNVTFAFSHPIAPFHLGFSVRTCHLIAVPHATAFHTCRVHYTPTAVAPYDISAAYGGDAVHAPSDRSTVIKVWRFTRTAMICRPRSLGFHEHSECTARVVDLTTARYRSLPTGRVYFSGYVGGYLPRGSCRLRGDRARSDSFCTVTYVPRDANGRYALTATYPGNVEYHASGDHTDVAVDYTNTQTRLTCDAGNVDEFHTIRCLAQVFDADPNNPRRPPTGDIAWNGNLSTATFIPTNTCHLHAAFPASAGFSACNVGFRLSDQYVGQPGGLPIDAIYQPDTRHWLASSDSVYKTINPECIVPDYLISQDWQIAIYTLQLANCNQGKVIVEDYADARGGEILGLGPERGSPELGSYDKRPPWTKIDLTVQKCPYGEPLSDC